VKKLNPNYYLILIIVLTTISSNLLAGGSKNTRKGDKEGNGGTIVFNGKTYELADLHFERTEFKQLKMTLKLRRTISFFVGRLESSAFLTLEKEGKSFESDYIFNPTISYKFVEKLPSNCLFISEENLPTNMNFSEAGCTQGSTTYIQAEEFRKLNLAQKALLIIHERLHEYSPRENYEVKTMLIKGLYLLATKVELGAQYNEHKHLTDKQYESLILFERKSVAQHPLWFFGVQYFLLNLKTRPSEKDFYLNENELAILNNLSRTVSQLNEETTIKKRIFTKKGAMIGGNKNEIHFKNINLGPGAIIFDSKIKGKNIEIENSSVLFSEVIGEDILISKTKMRYNFIKGENIRLKNSDLVVSFLGSSRMNYYETLEGYSYYRRTIIRNRKRYNNSRKNKKNWTDIFEQKIAGKNIFLNKVTFTIKRFDITGNNIEINNSNFKCSRILFNYIKLEHQSRRPMKKNISFNHLSINNADFNFIKIDFPPVVNKLKISKFNIHGLPLFHDYNVEREKSAYDFHPARDGDCGFGLATVVFSSNTEVKNIQEAKFTDEFFKEIYGESLKLSFGDRNNDDDEENRIIDGNNKKYKFGLEYYLPIDFLTKGETSIINNEDLLKWVVP